MRPSPSLIFPLLFLGNVTLHASEHGPSPEIKRVVFLGDSITYSGQYIEFIESYLKLCEPAVNREFLNLGLPSETLSGLTEPGHANGDFPRPDLHERLDRVLAETKPDLIVACYGMNDGVYHPYDEKRFAKFREGILFLRDHAKTAGVKIIHVTPPTFDPAPIKKNTLPLGLAEYRRPYEGYDDVLSRYSSWLVDRRKEGWDVIDIHTPMAAHLVNERRLDPNYRLADDGVHLNAVGHALIARAILQYWGASIEKLNEGETFEKLLATFPHGTKVFELVQQKQRVLKDAYLTAVRHKRPGMARGLTLADAQKLAAECDVKIRDLIGR